MFVPGFPRVVDGYHCGMHMLVTGHPGKEARSLVYPAEIEFFICQRHMDLPNPTHPCQLRGSQACRDGSHTGFSGKIKRSTQESPTERFSVPCPQHHPSMLSWSLNQSTPSPVRMSENGRPEWVGDHRTRSLSTLFPFLTSMLVCESCRHDMYTLGTLMADCFFLRS